MVFTSMSEMLFQSADNGPEWHITTDRDSLCGQARLRFNVDNTADTLPLGGAACPDCLTAKDPSQSITAAAAVVAPKKRTRKAKA